MSEQLSRQQIYDRIRSTSKDSYILEEMQRLGFWELSASPSLSETIIKREASLTQELNKLLEQDRKYSDHESMLKEMRKTRMKAAKAKREETKQKHKQKRQEKAESWKKTQLEQIIFLGKGVSGGLHKALSDLNLLQKFDLPIFDSAFDLANKMNLDIPALRYLLYQRRVSKINHYHIFEIPKKSGGKRRISAPKRRLKEIQLWVMDTILNRLPVSDVVHGFIKNCSIVTNAKPHLNKDIVINVDLKDFFPSISYNRVKGLFHKMGYSEQLSTIFGLICTQSDTEEVMIDNVRYYVQKGERVLPQGSPASPAISNLIAYKMDRKIVGLAAKLNFEYTRYADDLSFSAPKGSEKNIAKLLYFIKKIIESEGFVMHPDKTHIMRRGAQQKVTGVVVNDKLNVERNKLRKFRALLHNIETRGWKDQQWGKAKHLINAIEGYIHFIQMVNPDKGKQFKEKLAKIIEIHGYPEITKPSVKREIVEEVLPEIILREDSKDSSKNDWWNIL